METKRNKEKDRMFYCCYYLFISWKNKKYLEKSE